MRSGCETAGETAAPAGDLEYPFAIEITRGIEMREQELMPWRIGITVDIVMAVPHVVRGARRR
jgi:hypothetical protein